MATRNSRLFYLLTLGQLLLSPMLASGSDFLEFLKKMENSYASVNDYTALFRKQERVSGKLKPAETIFLKFQKPFKFYMRWLDGAHAGREAVYVEGLNDNKVFVHEPRGLARFVTVLLEPDGDRVLKESRFPFTEIGIGRIIERMGEGVYKTEVGKPLTLVDRGRETIQGREFRRLEGLAAPGSKESHPFHKIILVFDEQLSLPSQIVLYDWDNLMIGEYLYNDIRLNPGLQKADFDTSNPNYNFPHWVISH